LSKPELAKVGVGIVNPETLLLECKTCGAMWEPEILVDIDQPEDDLHGTLPEDYWHCPNGCNV